jgi:hypothetical protein
MLGMVTMSKWVMYTLMVWLELNGLGDMFSLDDATVLWVDNLMLCVSLTDWYLDHVTSVVVLSLS